MSGHHLPPPCNRPSGVTEAMLKSMVHTVLKNSSLWFFRVAAHHGYGAKGASTTSQMRGIPDYLILKNGVLYGAELKAHGSSLSEHQADMIKRMNAAGANCAVVCSLEGLNKLLTNCSPSISTWIVPIYF